MSDLEVISHNARYWVRRGEQLCAAYCKDYHRSYIHPLYTPGGVQVVENAPPDHPHQQGIGYGHGAVNGYDFWSGGAYARPATMQRTGLEGALQYRVEDDAVVVEEMNVWVTEDWIRIARERRRLIIRPLASGTVVDWLSVVEAAYGPLVLGQTLDGGIAVRRHHQLEARLGGLIVDSAGRQGEKNVMEQDADWVAFQGTVSGRQVGIAFFAHPKATRCPWFVRDYGLANINPCRHRPIQVELGGKYFAGARIVAFDGTAASAGVDDMYRQYVAGAPAVEL